MVDLATTIAPRSDQLNGDDLIAGPRTVMVQVWGPDGSRYQGRSMTLYLDPEVKFGGMKVGGIRISHMSHIDRMHSLMLTTARSKKGEYRVKPLAANQDEEAINQANEAADKGTEAFTTFWNSDFGKQHREVIKPHIENLKARAQKADEANTPLSQRLSQAAEEPQQQDADPFSDEYNLGLAAAKDGDERVPPTAFDEQQVTDWLGGYDFGSKEGAAG